MGLFNKRPYLLKWYDRVRNRNSYKVAIENWLDDEIINLMLENGQGEYDKVQKIIEEGS
jgi:hypothetical protein